MGSGVQTPPIQGPSAAGVSFLLKFQGCLKGANKGGGRPGGGRGGGGARVLLKTARIANPSPKAVADSWMGLDLVRSITCLAILSSACITPGKLCMLAVGVTTCLTLCYSTCFELMLIIRLLCYTHVYDYTL